VYYTLYIMVADVMLFRHLADQSCDWWLVSCHKKLVALAVWVAWRIF